jgi:hypothetical protein
MRVIGPGYAVFVGDDGLIFVVNPEETRAVSPHPEDPEVLCCYSRYRGPIIKAEVEFALRGWVHDYGHAEAYLRGEEPSLFVPIAVVFDSDPDESTGRGRPIDDPT